MVRKTRSSIDSDAKAASDHDDNRQSDDTSETEDSPSERRQSDRKRGQAKRHRPQEHRHLRKVFFLRKDLLLKESAALRIVRLRNPANAAEPSYYICQHDERRYFALMRYQEPNRCWLVDDRIAIDGTLYVTTPVDPLFLVLPYVREQCAERFVPLDHALKDERYPDIERFVDALPIEQILLIADTKGPADLRAVRFSEQKTLDWLAFKCDRYMKAMVARGFHIETGSKSETYVKSAKLNVDAGNDARLSLSISLLNEYLPPALHGKLLTRLGAELAKPKTGQSAAKAGKTALKRKSSAEAEKSDGGGKRAKEDSDRSGGSASESPSGTPNRPDERKTTARDRALAKAATGTKGIMSFFAKK